MRRRPPEAEQKKDVLREARNGRPGIHSWLISGGGPEKSEHAYLSVEEECATINGSVYLSIDLSSNTSINLCLYVRVLLSVSLLVPLKESAERRNQANQANQSLPSFSMSFESLLISSSVALSLLASSSFPLVPSTTLLTHATSVLSRSFVLGQ